MEASSGKAERTVNNREGYMGKQLSGPREIKKASFHSGDTWNGGVCSQIQEERKSVEKSLFC